jgi:hypothetical protein
MKFRLTAFGLHLLGSASAVALILGGLWLGWYRWPAWYLTGVVHVVAILALVDLALGPTLTAIVANPKKPRRQLARDIGVIVTVQLIALGYGAVTLWMGRPLYYTFSVDRLQMVQASDVPSAEGARGRAENPALAAHWYSRPQWVWAPLPADPAEAVRIAQASIMGGPDVIEMPRYFKPWSEALPELRPRLKTLDKIRELDRHERSLLGACMQSRGLAPDAANAMLLWSADRRVLVVFDPATLAIRDILTPDCSTPLRRRIQPQLAGASTPSHFAKNAH